MHRVLRVGGAIALVWNVRGTSTHPWMQRLEDLIEANADSGQPRGQSREWEAPLRAFGGFTALEELHLPRGTGVERRTEDDLIAYLRSMSFIAKQPEERKAALMSKVQEVLRDASTPSLLDDEGRRVFEIPLATDYYFAKKQAMAAADHTD